MGIHAVTDDSLLPGWQKELSQDTRGAAQLAGTADDVMEVEDHSAVVSIFDFMKKTVLPTLDVNSHQYLLLQEFLVECNKSSHSGPVCEVHAIDVHVSNPGTVVSTGASALNKGAVVSPEVSYKNDDVVPDSDSSMSSNIPYPDLSSFLHQPLNTEEHTAEKAGGESESKSQKRYFCLFCDKAYVKIKQHLISQHSDALEVVELQTKEGKEMEKYLLKLRNFGNHKHNCTVLQSGVGTLVVAYTPNGTAIESVENYVPCPYCFGYYERKQLWRHSKYRCLW